MGSVSDKALLQAAREARERAFAPYSRFRVGAAVLTGSGRIFTGCNVENASYGLTICAERLAIFKAVSEGELEFKKLAVVADTDELTPPCGSCRQIIWEFCGDVPVIMGNRLGQSQRCRMGALFPQAFDGRFLKK